MTDSIQGRFVVLYHEKSAGDQHYDVMLEVDEVLWTWSFQTPPKINPGNSLEGRRIQDHRLTYLDFEGDIGRGLGRVEKWDSGTFAGESSIEVGEMRGELVIDFSGAHLFGSYKIEAIGDEAWLLGRLPD